MLNTMLIPLNARLALANGSELDEETDITVTETEELEEDTL